jgi:hypothetical protein
MLITERGGPMTADALNRSLDLLPRSVLANGNKRAGL